MPISALDAISPAIEHTKKQLFRPFRFSQWVRLALVGFLAGELGSGGGCNMHYNVPSTHYPRGSEQFLGASWPAHLTAHPAMLAALVVTLILVGLGLIVLFTYINSVMRFILFDSVVAKECHIRRGWVRRRQHGLRFFVWQIMLMLMSFAAFVLLIGFPLAFAWIVGWFDHPSEHLLPLVLGGILLFLLFLALIVVMALVYVMTKDFVVPQMALEDIGALEGWRRLWLWLKAEKGGYAGYIALKIGLAIAAGILFAIIGVIVFVILLIPVGGAGVVAVLAGKAAGLTWNVYTITLAVAAGCILLALLIFVFSLISVPIVVFFPAYSIYFLAARYPALAALLRPTPPGSAGPASPPVEAPPLSPTPAPLG